MTAQYEYHEYAALFPMMSEEERRDLAESMRQHGFMEDEPIILYQGKILDGRNRYEQALEVHADPVFKDYDGDNPLGYVIAKNKDRRHLTSSQKAAVALRLLPYLEEQAKARQATSTGGTDPQLTEEIPEAEKGEARQKAAEALGTNPRYVSDMKRINEEAPGLGKMVERGRVSVPAAVDILNHAPDLVDDLIANDISVSEIREIIRERHNPAPIPGLPAGAPDTSFDSAVRERLDDVDKLAEQHIAGAHDVTVEGPVTIQGETGYNFTWKRHSDHYHVVVDQQWFESSGPALDYYEATVDIVAVLARSEAADPLVEEATPEEPTANIGRLLEMLRGENDPVAVGLGWFRGYMQRASAVLRAIERWADDDARTAEEKAIAGKMVREFDTASGPVLERADKLIARPAFFLEAWERIEAAAEERDLLNLASEVRGHKMFSPVLDAPLEQLLEEIQRKRQDLKIGEALDDAA